MAKIKKIKKIPTGTKISGLTTKQILNMDVYKLSTQYLRKVTSRLISSANKRIRRLKEKAPHSQALRRHPNQFSLKGIKKNDRNSVEMLMKEIRNFMNAESSTIKGFEEQRERVKEQIGDFESVEQENDFWHAFNEWVDSANKNNKNLAHRFNDSFQLREMFFERFVTRGMSSRGAKASMTREVNKILNKQNTTESQKTKEMEDALKNEDALEITSDI